MAMEPDFKILQGDGTRLSGLVTDEENQTPRECGNCIFYSKDHCHHPVVKYDDEVIGTKGEPKPVKDEWCCNFFRSPGRVLMYAVRHGEDENDDLIGGWEDAPIDEAGEKDAKEAAALLKDKGIRHLVCSDMKRTHETAKIIAKELGLTASDVVTDFRLRTWNKGELNGEEKSDSNKKTLDWYKERPHQTIPDGESHYQFEERSDEAFDYYLDKARNCGTYIIVMHNSGIKQMQRYIQEHQTGDMSKLTSTNDSPDSVAPGGVAQISENKGHLTCKIVLKERN
jgi:broad specificity phosphatase PhoE